MRAAGAEIVGAKVNCLAAVRAAVVDGLLELLDGHFGGILKLVEVGMRDKGCARDTAFRRNDKCVWCELSDEEFKTKMVCDESDMIWM